MGFLQKLFGGNKGGDFKPSTDTMPDDQFWRIIRETHKKANGDYEAQQEMLDSRLGKMTPQNILLFDNKFRQLRGEAYSWDLWGAAYIIHGGCSDDSFNDFRGWVIAQGKDFYYKTLANPETLAELDKEKFDVDWEGMGYISSSVFEEITDSEMPRGFFENTEIKGEEWDEEGDDLKTRFPLLWKKYA